LELPGDLIGVLDKDLGALFNAPIQTSNALLLSAYSRSFESEADDIGIKLAAKAGYDPSAMISSLYRMSYAMGVATGQTEQKSYFNSHPYTPDRTRAVEKIIAELDWEKQDPISDNFLMEFDSVLFGANPDIGVIRDNQFLHPILDFTVFFPENWNIDNQPTNVGGYHPDRQAAAFVSLDDPGLSPEQAGKRFINEMDREYKSKMKEATPYNFKGKEGYLIAFIDKSSKITMYAYVLWIPMDGKLFKILGIAPLKYEPQLDMIAESLRPLNESEKSSFTIDLLRVVKANKGETIADLSKRVGNVLNNELTAIINDKYEDDELEKDELIKVALTYPYYPVKQ
jgi:predicted Zn-dependent protease